MGLAFRSMHNSIVLKWRILYHAPPRLYIMIQPFFIRAIFLPSHRVRVQVAERYQAKHTVLPVDLFFVEPPF